MIPQSYATLKSNVLTLLQEAGTTVYGATELDMIMADACRDFATISPNISKVGYSIESRYGQASTTSANNLVDTTKGQFASGDVGKIVYNQNMKTWAVITSYASTSSIGLSRDIFQVSDAYQIFNKDCFNNKQVNISDVTDYLDVTHAEYPFGTKREVIHDWANPDIVEIDMAGQPEDSMVVSGRTQPNTQVYIYFNKRHKVSQLTDFSGVLAASCAAAATTISASALQTAGTIEADQEFSIYGVRGTYWTTAAIAITATTAGITFYPPLESAIASTGVVITFRQSTLKPQEESAYCQYVAGKAAISKSMAYYQQLNTTITSLGAATTAIASVAGKIQAGTVAIAAGTVELGKVDAIILTAATSLAASTTRLSAATAYIAAGSVEIAKAPANILLAATALATLTGIFNAATTYMAAGTVAASTVPGILATAATSLANIDARIQAATTAIAAGTTALALVPAIILTAATSLAASTTRLASATTYIASASSQVASATTQIAAASAEIALVNPLIDAATASINAGSAQINIIPDAGGLNDYLNDAASKIGAGNGYALSGQGFMQVSSASMGASGDYQNLASREIQTALGQISNANGYLSQAQGENALNTGWLNQANIDLQSVLSYVHQAQGYFQQATAEENLSSIFIKLTQEQLSMAASRIGESNGYIAQATANMNLNSGYLNSARTELETGNTHIRQAQGYFQQGQANITLNSGYLASANADFGAANVSINEAVANLRLVSSRLDVARGGNLLELWGQRQVNEATNRLRSIQGIKLSRKYSRY